MKKNIFQILRIGDTPSVTRLQLECTLKLDLLGSATGRRKGVLRTTVKYSSDKSYRYRLCTKKIVCTAKYTLYAVEYNGQSLETLNY